MSESLPFANEFRGMVDEALLAATRFDDNCPAKLADAIGYSLLAPGKRLRPMLVLLAAKACGGEPRQALPAAVAIEMIHAYSLVHDDLPAMDDDDLRRGRPTCHCQYDEATAILVGDALQARAFEVLADGLQPGERAARCCAELAKAAGAEGMVGGQSADLSAEFSSIGLEQLQSIHRRKTGALFRAAPRLGAIAVEANEKQIESLTQFSAKIGLAFQVVDDLLDVTGEQDQMGKRIGKDAEQGKATYPSLMGKEESQRWVVKLVDEASTAVDWMGVPAEPLRQFAQFVSTRSH